jgi:hypothetical protein
VNDARLFDAELDLTGLGLFDRLAHVHRDGADFRIRHQTTRTKHTTQTTYLSHHVGRRDDRVEVHESFLDLLHQVIRADNVRTSCLGLCGLVTLSEHQHTLGLTKAVWQHDRATDHLVRVTRVDAQAHGEIHRFVELRKARRLEQFTRLSDGVQLLPVHLANGVLPFATGFHTHLQVVQAIGTALRLPFSHR